MSKPKIVFAALRAGGGHVRPAEVICEALSRLFPNKYELSLLDFMKDLGCSALDSHHKRSWRFLLSHPLLTKCLQVLGSAGGPLTRWFLGLYVAPFHSFLKSYLETEKPDLIVSTHFLNTLAVSRVRRRHDLKVGLVNFLTEIFDCNTYWFLRDVDHYLVSSEQVRRQMTDRGFPGEKLHLVAYPIPSPGIPAPGEAAELKKDLGIDPERQTMMVSFGSEGIGPLEGLLAALAERRLPLNILVICGRNDGLKRRLENRFAVADRTTRIIPLGYIDYVRKIILAADICYIKPGPATTWEVMSHRKPILFTRSAHLSEKKVLRYACSLGIARYGGVSPRRVIGHVEEMMQRSFQNECRARYAAIRLPAGGEDIARFIDRALSGEGSGEV